LLKFHIIMVLSDRLFIRSDSFVYLLIMFIPKHIILFSIVLLTRLTASAQTIIIPDTTFIVRDTTNGNYHAIFIDTAKSSLYYDYINSFQFDEMDSTSYQTSVDCLKPFSYINNDIFGLPKRWLTLNIYKGNYYLYSPSDYINNYRVAITDSNYIGYITEGAQATKINSITETNQKTYRLELSNCNNTTAELFIHLIDPQRGIAVFEFPYVTIEGRYMLMVDADKAKNFPIIVNYGTVKFAEFKFEQPDFDRLLK
jgi:hypothetical protein